MRPWPSTHATSHRWVGGDWVHLLLLQPSLLVECTSCKGDDDDSMAHVDHPDDPHCMTCVSSGGS
jgi:hypothetical protein